MEKRFLLISVLILVSLGKCASQLITPGHAHNDYENEHPLLDAIEHNFLSIEVDIHLIQDQLYVAHNTPEVLDNQQTLEIMYLKPLLTHIQKNQGQVYKEYGGPVFLMLDIKSPGEETYKMLREILSDYSSIINDNGPLKVLVSGNRPVRTISGDITSQVGLDGRLTDLDMNIDASIMPIVSDNYGKYFGWDGSGRMPDEELVKLNDMVKKVHAQNKLLRFWAAPDKPNAWKVLLDSGVDIINTDRLAEFHSFMTAYRQ